MTQQISKYSTRPSTPHIRASRSLLPILLALLAPLTASAWDVPSGEYGLDKTHGYITFSYSHLGFSNPHVGFDSFEVSLDADADDPAASKVKVLIDAASINSRVEVFDEHLNGENFFDTATHSEITFASNSITATGENTFDIAGDLTIKGITKPVTLKATINKAADHPMRGVPTIGVTATTEVLRSEWGLAYAVPAVSDEVTIFIDVELPMNTDAS